MKKIIALLLVMAVLFFARGMCYAIGGKASFEYKNGVDVSDKFTTYLEFNQPYKSVLFRVGYETQSFDFYNGHLLPLQSFYTVGIDYKINDQFSFSVEHVFGHQMYNMSQGQYQSFKVEHVW